MHLTLCYYIWKTYVFHVVVLWHACCNTLYTKRLTGDQLTACYEDSGCIVPQVQRHLSSQRKVSVYLTYLANRVFMTTIFLSICLHTQYIHKQFELNWKVLKSSFQPQFYKDLYIKYFIFITEIVYYLIIYYTSAYWINHT